MGERNMRRINKIIVHCSATPEGKDFTVDDVYNWHVKGNGWSDIGYHFLVYRDGTIVQGRKLKDVGAHVRGHNHDSIGVCYIGGMDAANKHAKDTRTEAQIKSLDTLLTYLSFHFNSPVSGHNQYAAKACPSFDAAKEYDYINKKLGAMRLAVVV